MFVDFILTEDPPAADAGGRRVDVGRLADGFFVGTLPMICEFGGVIEISFENQEAGIFEVELVGEPVDRDDEDHAIEAWVLELPPPDPDFPVPRTRVLTFAAQIGAVDEVEMELAVYIRDQLDSAAEREWQASRFVVVRNL
ncbi:MAG: hypothetical protein H0W90_07205 [Actinobacteria bacterium]|nr:hypothetical protein [Actinomycetota bacterium]